ncbi:DUF4893 domain-containing protein [Sphingomonas oleivorans]|uniref:DUF4893 domain-containing protein n=1 Tax=Sphingomonas oleivorans TaxID=1735121 RepID=UPI001FAF61BE|nr:DUF4893 domain-containing protein [Sphingomonas oleivorans]
MLPSPLAVPSAPPQVSGWRAVATEADRARLRNWRTAWMDALAKARNAGAGMRIVAQGALLAPDAALVDPAPPPGDYRCRVIKLGAQSAGLPDYIAYPYFACRIAGADGERSLRKLDGSQRPAGLIYPDSDRRMIFLGTMVLGDEKRGLAYGRDADRDMVGLVERVGPRRWRLVLPYPRWESTLDVIELLPRD